MPRAVETSAQPIFPTPSRPATQGAAVMVKMQASRWRCLNGECERRTFTDQLPEIVCPHARRTQQIAELVHLIGHGTGGAAGREIDEAVSECRSATTPSYGT